MADEVSTGPAWVRRQLLITVIGTVIAAAGLLMAVLGLVAYPWHSGDAASYAITATVGAGLLTLCCLVNLVGWLVARGSGVDRVAGPSVLRRVSLGAHVLSYVAVLVGMFGALSASALAGWDSPSGVYFGICFLVIIFGQILAGTQYLRTAGPPGTVPNHLRRLNEYVKSQR